MSPRSRSSVCLRLEKSVSIRTWFGLGVLVVGTAGLLLLLTHRPEAAVASAALTRSAVDSYIPPKGYVCCRAPAPITIDGRLDEAAWQAAPWSDAFVDIEGDRQPRPRYRT